MFRYLAAALAVAALVVPAAQADRYSKSHSGPAPANAVTVWSTVSQNAISVGRPPASSEALQAMVHAAIYDTVLAAKREDYEPFAVSARARRHVSTEAAVAAVTRGLLVVRVPAQAASVEGQYATYLAGIPDGEAKTNGLRLGRTVAGAYLGLRSDDGYDNVVPFVQPPVGPGVFEPIPFGSTPVDVKLGQVRPLTFDDPAHYRPDGPDPITSASYAQDLNEVKALGRVDSAVRTAEQTTTARFWTEHAMSQANRWLIRLALSQHLDVFETARMMAMAHVSAADTLVACWEAKYYFLYWRPQTAIQRADTDGNPATTADPGWTHLVLGNHPEYPSGHACLTSGWTYGAEAFFGTDRLRLLADSTVTGMGTERTFERLRDIRAEVTLARIYGGLHFREAMEDGMAVGRHVSRHVTRNFFEEDD